MKKVFNKFLLIMSLSIAFATTYAQGLEGIVVEKYYIASAADNAADPTLPIGAVTYRVYANLATGWGLQAVYGVPGHNLKINSTSNFYNKTTKGKFAASFIDNTELGNGATALGLDSYFTIGTSSDASFGVLKTEDDGVDNFLTGSTILNNVQPLTGIGLKVQDGNIAGTDGNPTIVGIPTSGAGQNQIVFANTTNGSTFNDDDGAISTGNPAGQFVGPTASNHVLIGQFTTLGAFGYELNIQIRNVSTLAVEKWVARDPVGTELSMGSLILEPNVPPTLTSFTAIPNGSVIVGTPIVLTGTATDPAPGTVASIKFYHNGTLLLNDMTSPYTTTFNAIAGSNTFTAVAFDNSGDSSAIQTIVVTGGSNQAPTVTISGVPSTITQPDVVTVSASPIDVDGTISNVKFYLDNVLVFTDNAAPWEYVWPSVVGNHNFKATAEDNLGLTGAFSATSSITVVLNNPPTCVLTSPLVSGSYTAPSVVPIAATATDLLDVVSPGGVVKVRFYVNGLFVGEDLTAPYSFNWTSSVGTAVFVARSIDNRGDSTSSAPITLEIADPNALPYKIVNLNQTCVAPAFCLTIAAVDTVANVIGYDIVLNYDKNKVIPTGKVTINNDLVDSTHVDVANSIDEPNGKMNISLYFNSNAPAGSTWNGNNGGNIICVEFAKKPSFGYKDTANFTISTLQESYVDGVKYPQASAGKFTTYKDSLVKAPLQFWYDLSPIVYSNAAANLITNIYGTDNAVANLNGTCGNRSAVPVQPNANGYFSHSIWNGLYLDIERNILPTTSVQSVVNGYDVYLVRRLLILDPTFRPNIYQMIAMDVNRDGVISAGDASQIAQRAVLLYPEFRQSWNYNEDGTRKPGYADSKDWTFMVASTVTTNNAFGISTTFPADNGIGFSKYRVPVIPFCLPTPVVDANDCPIISAESYTGIMLGDVNGSYSSIPTGPNLRNYNRVVFDVSSAISTPDGFVDVPVSIISSEEVHSLDFALNTSATLSYHRIINLDQNNQVYSHFNIEDNTLRLSSNSLQQFNVASPVISIRLKSINGKIDANDLRNVEAMINGESVVAEIRSTKSFNDNVFVYPNPSSSEVFVSLKENSSLQMFDFNGKEIASLRSNLISGTNKVDVSALPNGIYTMKISNDKFSEIKKIIISK